MSNLAMDLWQDLFEPTSGTQGGMRALYELSRGGTPWLYLPARGRTAAQGLALYPAQSFRARLARRVLSVAVGMGWYPKLRRVEVQVNERDPFAAFLREMAGTNLVPEFVVLAGNPRAPGRRFVFLLFDAAGNPVTVIKAGASEGARQLIDHEEEFLRAGPKKANGLPRLKDGYRSMRVRAFALDFVCGDAPRNVQPVTLKNLLTSWLAIGERVQMSQLPAWQRLAAVLDEAPANVRTLGNATFCPTLMHGDLAPWNVKDHAGKWTVLDWERADLRGVPGWDWFHFELQPALLVRHESGAELFARSGRLLQTPEFLAYAKSAGIEPLLKPLLLAYLATCLRVTRQTEGREQLLDLERIATRTWLGGH